MTGQLIAFAVGAPGPWIPVIVLNGTGETLHQPTVGVEAHSASGELLAVGSTDEVVPFLLEPGGYGIANVNMGTEIEWSDDIILSLDFGGVPSEVADDFSEGLTLVEYDPDEGVGRILNGSEFTVGGLFLRFACFDESGKLRSIEYGSAASQELAAGETTGIELLTTGDDGCARFLLIASGGNYG